MTGRRGRIHSVSGYELDFYEDEHGNEPVRRWLREELTLAKR